MRFGWSHFGDKSRVRHECTVLESNVCRQSNVDMQVARLTIVDGMVAKLDRWDEQGAVEDGCDGENKCVLKGDTLVMEATVQKVGQVLFQRIPWP